MLDTRTGLGAPAGRVGSEGVVDLVIAGVGGVPEVGAGAVALNVTAVDATAWSYITAWPTGAPRPDASNLNVEAGDTIPNLVVVKIGAGGRVSLYNFAGEVDLLADVVGWFPEGTGIEPLVPARVLDTRTGVGAPAAKVGADGVVDLTVNGRGGVPDSGVGAVVLNVTAVDATAWSYITAWPTGASRPDASNLNVEAGDTIPNLVIVKVGDGGRVSLYNFAGEVDLLADVVGWFPAGGGLQPLVPARVLDTRTGVGAPAAKVGADGVVDLTVTGRGGVPDSGVGAVVLNVTAVDATAWSYITAWPTGAPRPEASNLNVEAGDTIPNLVIVKVGDGGRVSLYNFAGEVDLLADVVGWFPDAESTSTTMSPAVGTVIAGAADVVASDGVTVILSASADVPAVGGHLVVLRQALVPAGLAGRVTAVSANADGTTTVVLVPANLQDMFAGLIVHGLVAPAPGSAPLDQMSTASASAAVPLVSTECSTDNGQPIVAPKLTVGAYDGHADFDLWGGTAEVVLRAQASLAWALQLSVTASCSIETPKALVAVVGPLTFELGAAVTASVSATTSASFTTHAPITVGFDYADGDVTNLSAVDMDGSTSIGSTNGTIDASVFAAATLDVKVAGVAGIVASVGPRATLSVGYGCATLVGELAITLAAEVGRWGIDWDFDLADIVLGSKTLYSQGCGAMAWTGELHATMDAQGEFGADPPYDTHFVDHVTATMTLLPTHQQTYLSAASGSYATEVTASGHSQIYDACLPDETKVLAGDVVWALNGATRPAVELTWDQDAQQWRYRPARVEFVAFDPWTVDAAGTYTDGCGGGTQPLLSQLLLGWAPDHLIWEEGLMNDVDPDPSRLVGTTTWTQTKPTQPGTMVTTNWTYTLTYDLHLVDTDTL